MSFLPLDDAGLSAEGHSRGSTKEGGSGSEDDKLHGYAETKLTRRSVRIGSVGSRAGGVVLWSCVLGEVACTSFDAFANKNKSWKN